MGTPLYKFQHFFLISNIFFINMGDFATQIFLTKKM